MDAILNRDLVTLKNQKAFKLNEKSHYGNLNNDELHLSLIEALYLVEKEKINVLDGNKVLSLKDFQEIIIEQGLFLKYLVFKDLRNRGYVIKTGFKYGSEFRLYERGRSPGDGHSDYLVRVYNEDQEISVNNFSSYVRVAHGVNKKMFIAVVDSEYDITYYNVEWTRP
jgi:tRNA-intron endonuclease